MELIGTYKGAAVRGCSLGELKGIKFFDQFGYFVVNKNLIVFDDDGLPYKVGEVKKNNQVIDCQKTLFTAGIKEENREKEKKKEVKVEVSSDFMTVDELLQSAYDDSIYKDIILKEE